MAQEIGREPDNDLATRTGEFAMAIYSVGRSQALILSPTFAEYVYSRCPRWYSTSTLDAAGHPPPCS